MREPFTTSVLSSTTSAAPECVWQALTWASGNLGVPVGLCITSQWEPGVPVRLSPRDGGDCDELCTYGEVLSSVAPRRLSYTLGAGAIGGDPTAIITWLITTDADDTFVTLTIDDLAPGGCDDIEIAQVWERVVTSLTAALDSTGRAEGTTPER
jgi:hypothetical protein